MRWSERSLKAHTHTRNFRRKNNCHSLLYLSIFRSGQFSVELNRSFVRTSIKSIITVAEPSTMKRKKIGKKTKTEIDGLASNQ